MVFMFDFAVSTGLIALGVGAGFLVWARRNQGAGTLIAHLFGFIITILAILTLYCSIHHGYRYWSKGFFEPKAAMMMMKKHHCMMGKDNCPSMKDKMMMNSAPMDYNSMHQKIDSNPELKEQIQQMKDKAMEAHPVDNNTQHE